MVPKNYLRKLPCPNLENFKERFDLCLTMGRKPPSHNSLLDKSVFIYLEALTQATLSGLTKTFIVTTLGLVDEIDFSSLLQVRRLLSAM